MSLRGFFLACAALVLCTTLAETANAYPTTARSGATTVTGLYRPLDLTLGLVDGTDALDYCAGCFGGDSFGYFATYGGSYAATYGTDAFSGDAGAWSVGFSAFGSSITNDGANTITLSTTNVANSVGSLNFVGGGSYAGVPPGDTPEDGDIFQLFATAPGDYLQVTCSDGVATCASFTVRLLQDLKLLGPYVFDGVEGYLLDDGTGCVYNVQSGSCTPRTVARVNEDCVTAQGPCGLMPKDAFRASSDVPEPASLALVGLGLVALAIGRRQARSQRA